MAAILTGQTALVTGAATGIGRATALALAAEGARLWINHRDQHDLAERVVEQVIASGGCAWAIEADVSDPVAVATMFETIEAQGPLDLLVNNAGVILEKPFLETSEADWARVLGVDLAGVYRCCRHALAQMQPRRSGVIVNVASDLGFLGREQYAAYCTAKAGVIGLTRSLAREFAADGIRINGVAPGPIATAMVSPEHMSDEWMARSWRSPWRAWARRRKSRRPSSSCFAAGELFHRTAARAQRRLLDGRMNSLMPQGMLVGGAIMWGLGWLPLQFFAARGLAGMPLVLLTYSLLSLLALPVLWQQRRQWASQYRQVLTMGLCGGWATAALVTALAEGNVVRVMLLFYLAPVWAMVGGWLLLGERLSGTRLFALGLAMLGIGLTLGVTSEALDAPGANDWLALSAGLAFSLNNLATRAADRVPLASKALVSFVGSALLGGLFCLLLRQPLPPLDLTLSWQIALLALGWLVSMAAVQYGLTHLEAGRAAVLVVFELIAAVLSSAWFGSHAIGPNEWLGAALVTTAALIAGWPERPLSIATRSTCA